MQSRALPQVGSCSSVDPFQRPIVKLLTAKRTARSHAQGSPPIAVTWQAIELPFNPGNGAGSRAIHAINQGMGPSSRRDQEETPSGLRDLLTGQTQVRRAERRPRAFAQMLWRDIANVYTECRVESPLGDLLVHFPRVLSAPVGVRALGSAAPG